MHLCNHFSENLLCYNYTNCKSYLSFLGKRSPGGAYSFICNWLREQSKEPLKFPNGLVKAIFDNSQKVGKTYLISSTNIVPTSVITSHLWVVLDEQSEVQNKKELSPINWIYSPLSQAKKTALVNLLSKPSMEYRITRNRSIQSCIQVVINEVENKVNIMDERVIVNVDPYKIFHQEPTSVPKLSCMAGELDFINPNSFHNIIQVLQAIGIYFISLF